MYVHASNRMFYYYNLTGEIEVPKSTLHVIVQKYNTLHHRNVFEVKSNREQSVANIHYCFYHKDAAMLENSWT